MPFKAMVGKALGGCWGDVGEVQLWVWLSIWSCGGLSVLGQSPETELSWLVSVTSFNAMVGKALRGCCSEVGEVRLWVRLSIWSCTGALGFGPES